MMKRFAVISRRAYKSSKELVNPPFATSSTSPLSNFKTTIFRHASSVSPHRKRFFTPPKKSDYVNKFVGEAKNELDKTTATIIHLANVGPTIRSDAISEMDAAIDALALNLSKLYNGRASRGMIDHLMVQVGNKGVKKELHTMASVSVLDPKTLTGPNRDLKSLNRAIISSPLHFTTSLTKGHKEAVCKEVSKFSKDAKEQIGSARKKALDSINEALSELSRVKHEANAVSAFSIEDARRLKEEIEDLTQKFTKSVEDICKVKNEESQGRSLLIAPVGFMGSLP